MSVELPKIKTLIPQIPFEYVGAIINREDLIRPSAAADKYVSLREDIVPARLVNKKATSAADSAYTLPELKDFAKRAGIPSAQNKDKLIEALREALQL